jgi:NAD(P)H-flavin reductase
MKALEELKAGKPGQFVRIIVTAVLDKAERKDIGMSSARDAERVHH